MLEKSDVVIDQFLPRDARHKHGLCGGCLSHPYIAWKTAKHT